MLKVGMFIQNRYEIISKIGSGGMADVYKAKDHKLNRFVAVKVMKKEFRDDKQFISKFRVEAQSAAGLAHANIVNIYDVGEEAGIYYIVMELVKNYAYAKSKVNLAYFRDSNAKEIDVFVEENNVIHPLEIKKSAAPDRREIKKYSVIDKASLIRGNGGIICMCQEPIPIDADNCFIPSNLI